jgi:hypothetical protein
MGSTPPEKLKPTPDDIAELLEVIHKFVNIPGLDTAVRAKVTPWILTNAMIVSGMKIENSSDGIRLLLGATKRKS